MNEQIKRMRLRRDGRCGLCSVEVSAGTDAGWDKGLRQVVCLTCLGAGEPVATVAVEVEVEVGDPGASLEREYERRRETREARVRQRFPRIGGAILAVSGEPETTKAFARGAEGERRLAARMEKLSDGQALFLHNRRRGPGPRDGDIDHIAVAPSGVFVIDAKHYAGAKVRVRRTGGLFRPVREQLLIRRWDRTSLVASLHKQHRAVSEALGIDAVPVTALFCFVDADLPLFEKLSIQGFSVNGPRATGALLRRPGPLDADQRREIWEKLGRALQPA
ncbi:MAG: nuclease-related domain-containing protein [Nocardioides sp.]